LLLAGCTGHPLLGTVLPATYLRDPADCTLRSLVESRSPGADSNGRPCSAGAFSAQGVWYLTRRYPGSLDERQIDAFAREHGLRCIGDAGGQMRCAGRATAEVRRSYFWADLVPTRLIVEFDEEASGTFVPRGMALTSASE
jgi:hypothetical protein